MSSKKREMDDFIVNDDDFDDDLSVGDDDEEEEKKTAKPKKKGANEAAKKKQKTTEGSSAKNENGETYFDLGNNRRVTIRKWKQYKQVDIREFYTDNSGADKPGKKGLALSADQWKKIKELFQEIDDAIDAL
ncbi:hypothetical protein MP638_002899 [Amoeboaphelidium occidentale]|nr:hypothetical protein MP638_002899 [Amoeboaphelidium occidentale]